MPLVGGGGRRRPRASSSLWVRQVDIQRPMKGGSEPVAMSSAMVPASKPSIVTCTSTRPRPCAPVGRAREATEVRRLADDL